MLKKDWKPSASLEALRFRQHCLDEIRSFFKERGFLEVETPLLSPTVHSDPFVGFFKIPFSSKPPLYLQTSPEFYMKRILAAYPEQPIFQICKAFRLEEKGQKHNPEFSMLEWYSPFACLSDLEQQVSDLFKFLGIDQEIRSLNYGALFEEYLGCCPYTDSLAQLKTKMLEKDLKIEGDLETREACCDALMGFCIEPHLGWDAPVSISGYLGSQAALAEKKQVESLKGTYEVAERFEVYWKGVELANAFQELRDPEEQRRRFQAECSIRKERGLPVPAIDEQVLEALHSLPSSSGIALGLDRLIWILFGKNPKGLSEIVTFTIDQ